MVFDLVLLLMLALFLSRQSFSEETQTDNGSCHAMCPPGYYKVGECDGQFGKYRCKRCVKGSFTAIPNHIEKCQRCNDCGNYETVIQNCSDTSDVVCECKQGYYDADPESSLDCQLCYCHHCTGDSARCQFCHREECQSHSECKTKCTATPNPPTTTTTPSRNLAGSTASTPTQSDVPQMWMAVIMVLSLVLLLFLIWISHQNCPRWDSSRDLESPTEFNESWCIPSSRPTTVMHKITEETHTMTPNQSPATPETHLLPDPEHKAARQEEQQDHWPAVILYAIIKEVPLRRWKEFLRLLSVADQELERVELEAGFGLGFMERQYQMLRLWSQRSNASLDTVFSALQYMDLSGCAQLLQERLERLK